MKLKRNINRMSPSLSCMGRIHKTNNYKTDNDLIDNHKTDKL